MITSSSNSASQREQRFECMLAMFSLSGRTADGGQRSILCRILNGHGLGEARGSDLDLLTNDEKGHYARLSDPHTHALHCRARAELRRMLAREIEVDPRDIPIVPDQYGKPHCLSPEAADLDFSVAHSCDCAIIGVGEVNGLGVDVEFITGEQPPQPLVEVVFHPDEMEHWLALPLEQRSAAFANAWVIKEAALKAVGTGLDGSPQEVRVRIDAKGQVWPAASHSDWVFERLHVSPHYAAWLAVIP